MVFHEFITRAGKVTTMLWYVFSAVMCSFLLFYYGIEVIVLVLECVMTSLYCFQVMDMLGPSLWDVWNNNSHT